MRTKSRITSILNAQSLDNTITRLPSFSLSQLNIEGSQDFKLPENTRLGHLVENIVSQLIKASSNYQVLYENVQLTEDKQTIGELDFITENLDTKKCTHLELAYKFYLFDPSISENEIDNWIGPNRNDSLKNKLEKTKHKQFPLLQHSAAKSALKNIETGKIAQALCLLVNLYTPYKTKESLSPGYNKAVKGYYLDLETFIELDNPNKTYHIPSKKEWGINPAENNTWTRFNNILEPIRKSMTEKQAVLCWQKQEETYLEFFLVWW